MNENGDYEVGIDEHDCLERLTDQHGGSVYRNVCLHVTMSPPPVIEIDVVIPDEAPGDVTVLHHGGRRPCRRRAAVT